MKYGNRGNNQNFNSNSTFVHRGSRGNRSGSGKKHSGCKSGVFTSDTRKNVPYVQGWNYSRAHGMVSIMCSPYSKTHVVTSGTGKNWETWIAKITPKMSAPFVQPCLFEVGTGRVIIKGLGIVMNPRAANGGYCGKFGGK